MAARIPMVIGANGLEQQLQPGDTLLIPGGGGPGQPGPAGFTFQTNNGDLPIIPAGGAVFPKPGGGGMVLASAVDATKTCFALSQSMVLTGQQGVFQTAGLFQMSDWSLVTGSPLLTPGAYYFLSPTVPGALTTNPPTARGQVNQLIGKALFTDTMILGIDTPLLL